MKNLLIVLTTFICFNLYSQNFTEFFDLEKHEIFEEEVEYKKSSEFYPKGTENSTHAIAQEWIDNLIGHWRSEGYGLISKDFGNRSNTINIQRDGIMKTIYFKRYTEDTIRILFIKVTSSRSG